MFVQNFIELSAAVHQLSCAQRKKTPTKTIQSVVTARTVNACTCEQLTVPGTKPNTAVTVA